MKRILLTIYYADGLHGGVKYCAELGEYFHSLGYDVYCAGVITNDFILNFLNKHHVKLYNVLSLPLDIKYDLVWTHHFPILPYLITKGIKYNRVINSCISKILPIDRFCWFKDNIDLFLTLSPQTKNMFIKEYGFPKNKIYILPNMAPDKFFTFQVKNNTSLKSVAVVSNHIPAELTNALSILNKRNIKSVVYGGANPVDITPKILSQHDVIISIGKTVQYALAMGIPVYNYDHFGGSGYITTKNIDLEEKFNFSGRSFFTKKTSQQIADEIIHDYKEVLNDTSNLKEIAKKRYKLSIKVSSILKILKETLKAPHVKITNKNRIFFDYCSFIIESSAKHISEIIPQKKKGLARLFYHIRTMKF